MNNEPLITQREIIHLLSKKKKSKRNIKQTFKFISNELLIVLGVFAVSFFIVNWPAMSQKAEYWWKIDYQNKSSIATKPIVIPPEIPMDESKLMIGKINVEADIIWDIPISKSKPYLDKGIVHADKTAHPDEIGNVFISGHSSNYVWVKGKYQSIFSLIDKLLAGDKITLTYKGKIYQYIVVDSVIVKPTDLSVLKPTNEPILSLMTCYPVGTSNKRLVVRAKLVSPRINSINKQKNGPQDILKLPSFR
jgi:LPXTG-site transpeptidase (sortase) family protein